MPLSRRDFNDLAAIIRTTQTKWLGNGEAITAIGERYHRPLCEVQPALRPCEVPRRLPSRREPSNMTILARIARAGLELAALGLWLGAVVAFFALVVGGV